VHLSPDQYWNDLRACRNRAVRRRNADPWRDSTGQ
jgi:hypothetical protein